MPDLSNSEINRILAERVMGLTLAIPGQVIVAGKLHGYVTRKGIVYRLDDRNRSKAFSPATSIADAMECLEAWRKGDHKRFWTLLGQKTPGQAFVCAIWWHSKEVHQRVFYGESDESPALAICHALLAACGKDVR